jgi:hypothetical protein
MRLTAGAVMIYSPRSRGTRDAFKSGLMNKVECRYPSGKGQQLIAEMLLKAGLAPLR